MMEGEESIRWSSFRSPEVFCPKYSVLILIQINHIPMMSWKKVKDKR